MKKVHTFAEYLNDEERVTKAEREKINFEVELIGKMRICHADRSSEQKSIDRL